MPLFRSLGTLLLATAASVAQAEPTLLTPADQWTLGGVMTDRIPLIRDDGAPVDPNSVTVDTGHIAAEIRFGTHQGQTVLTLVPAETAAGSVPVALSLAGGPPVRFRLTVEAPPPGIDWVRVPTTIVPYDDGRPADWLSELGLIRQARAQATLTVPSFIIMKYTATSIGAVTGPGIRTQGTVGLIPGLNGNPENWADSRARCQSIGGGYDLAKETHLWALLHDVALVNANWTGGTAGTGVFKFGQNVANATAADSQPCAPNASCNPTATNWADRTLALSNGERIWDLGAPGEWTFCDDPATGACNNGLVARPRYIGNGGIDTLFDSSSMRVQFQPPASVRVPFTATSPASATIPVYVDNTAASSSLAPARGIHTIVSLPYGRGNVFPATPFSAAVSAAESASATFSGGATTRFFYRCSR